MSNKQVVVKRISEINNIPTTHGLGHKKILIDGNHTDISITQIAYTKLAVGDVVEKHVHLTMDEHFIILEGMCHLYCVGNDYRVEKGLYMYVPAGVEHRIEVVEPLTVITIGVATE